MEKYIEKVIEIMKELKKYAEADWAGNRKLVLLIAQKQIAYSITEKSIGSWHSEKTKEIQEQMGYKSINYKLIFILESNFEYKLALPKEISMVQLIFLQMFINIYERAVEEKRNTSELWAYEEGGGSFHSINLLEIKERIKSIAKRRAIDSTEEFIEYTTEGIHGISTKEIEEFLNSLESVTDLKSLLKSSNNEENLEYMEAMKFTVNMMYEFQKAKVETIRVKIQEAQQELNSINDLGKLCARFHKENPDSVGISESIADTNQRLENINSQIQYYKQIENETLVKVQNESERRIFPFIHLKSQKTKTIEKISEEIKRLDRLYKDCTNEKKEKEDLYDAMIKKFIEPIKVEYEQSGHALCIRPDWYKKSEEEYKRESKEKISEIDILRAELLKAESRANIIRNTFANILLTESAEICKEGSEKNGGDVPSL